MNHGLRCAPMIPANCPGITRPVLWMRRSGSTAAGGRLFRGPVAVAAIAAIEGQSLGRGLFGSNPDGKSLRPVSMM